MTPAHTVKRKIETFLPTEFGDFTIYVYQGIDNKEHIALVKGNVSQTGILCRVHSECLTGEVFGSLRCDCKEQLEQSFMHIKNENSGIIVYLRQEGRGIGLIEKLKAYRLQYQGKDTVDANIDLGHAPDMRDYKIAAEILHDLKISSIKILTNNPDKISQLEQYGITIEKRMPVIPKKINKYNKKYLQTKLSRMAHMLKSL